MATIDYKQKIKDYMNSSEVDTLYKSMLKNLFPELKESEDERIKKVLIGWFKRYKEEDICGSETFNEIPTDNILAWLEKQGEHANFRNKIQIGDKVTRNEDGMLVNMSQFKRIAKKNEKQGEQKPAETHVDWSEEDERMYRGLHNLIYSTPYCDSRKEFSDWFKSLKDRIQLKQEWDEEDEKCCSIVIAEFSKCAGKSVSKDEWMRCNDWLNSLRDRVQPQPKWSEEDEIMIKVLNSIIRYIVEIVDKDALERFGTNREELFSWLKSIKDRLTWKPSEEQIKALEAMLTASPQSPAITSALLGLYEQLKKLKE